MNDKNGQLCIYMFVSDDCPPCKEVESIVKGLPEHNCRVVRLTEKTDAVLFLRYTIHTVPTLVSLRGGRIDKYYEGVYNVDEYKKMFNIKED